MKNKSGGLIRPACLSDEASRNFSDQTEEDSCWFDVIDPFDLDAIKLRGSQSLRRLKDKSQVYCFPENPHVRTRLFHTMEVVNLAKIIANLLGLNEKLCEAIAWGHDIGHTPYGHLGEHFLTEKTGQEFRHEIFGVILAQSIERCGQGLNLSRQTLKGILFHSQSQKLFPAGSYPEEFPAVMWADKIAYTFSDIDDLVRHRGVKPENLPEIITKLGRSQAERIHYCLMALARESNIKGKVSFSMTAEAELFNQLRQWMAENVYQKEREPIFYEALDIAYRFLTDCFSDYDPALLLALMTDREVNALATHALSSGRMDAALARNFGVIEILPTLPRGKMDFSNPNLGDF